MSRISISMYYSTYPPQRSGVPRPWALRRAVKVKPMPSDFRRRTSPLNLRRKERMPSVRKTRKLGKHSEKVRNVKVDRYNGLKAMILEANANQKTGDVASINERGCKNKKILILDKLWKRRRSLRTPWIDQYYQRKLSWILLKSMTSLFSTVLLLYVPGENEDVAMRSSGNEEWIHKSISSHAHSASPFTYLYT